MGTAVNGVESRDQLADSLVTAPDEPTRERAYRQLDSLRQRLNHVIRGKSEVIELLIIALCAGGSVLLEDVPGVGKTTLAKSLAQSLNLDFQRVQCTPDLLPADIFGFSTFNPQDGSFSFRPGPIFCNVLLVDEINRASPRTQSALLEAMAEGQVTIEGVRRRLEQPFFVLATQNPAGFQGTSPLPESQLDRFLLHLSIGYPEPHEEVLMLFDQIGQEASADIDAVISRDELLVCLAAANCTEVEASVAEYIVQVATRTRQDHRLLIGCSPRGTIALLRASQAAAFVAGRRYVLPDDVQRMAVHVLRHRLVPSNRYGTTDDELGTIVQDILRQTPVPV